MVNFGPLAPEIDRLVWATPANFNGFRVLASLLQRRHSTEANQTLHDVWPSPGLVHYIYIFGCSFPIMEFCQVQNLLCVQVLCFPILAALLQGTQVVVVRQTLRRWAEGTTYIRQGDHHVGHWPTFFLCYVLFVYVCFCYVRFSFFSTTPREWLGRMSPKWPSVDRDVKP